LGQDALTHGARARDITDLWRAMTLSTLLIFDLNSVRSDSPLAHSRVSDDVFPRERLEVGDVTSAKLVAEFVAGIVKASHFAVVMRRDRQRSPFKWIPFLRHGPVGVESG